MATYFLSANRESVQEDPFLLLLSGGSILGLWSDLHPDPGVAGHYGVYGRIWAGDLSGAGLADAPVPDLTDDIQRSPSATGFADGGFAVTFESRGASARDGTDDPYYDTYVKFYDADGAQRGEARQVTRNLGEDQRAAGIVTLSNDQSITLVARHVGAGDYDLVAYRHGAEGRTIGGGRKLVEDAGVYVSSLTGAGYNHPDIAAGARGTYAVAWHERVDLGDDRKGYAVKARVFEADGAPVSAERVIAPVIRSETETFGLEQVAPKLTGRDAGGYAIAWDREKSDSGSGRDVYFRLLDAEGAPATRAVRVNTDRKSNDQFVEDVVDLGRGNTLVTYSTTIPDAFDDIFDGHHLMGRVMGPDGRWLTKSFRITEEIQNEFGGGNTVVNARGELVSTYSAELSYAMSEDVLITSRALTLPWRDGGRGDEVLRGTLVNDRISGGAGDDRIHGATGDDSLSGGTGDDTLYGNDGDDTLVGGRGDDRLVGGAGDDRLRGGPGEDVFVFTGGGRDVVEGFRRGTDLLEIGGASRDDIRELLASGRQHRADAVLDLGGGDSIRLKGTDLADLALSDFLL